MKAQQPDVVVPPPPVPPVLPPNPPERDDPTKPEDDPDWSDDELPPVLNQDAAILAARQTTAEHRLSVLMWAMGVNIVAWLLVLAHVLTP